MTQICIFRGSGVRFQVGLRSFLGVLVSWESKKILSPFTFLRKRDSKGTCVCAGEIGLISYTNKDTHTHTHPYLWYLMVFDPSTTSILVEVITWIHCGIHVCNDSIRHTDTSRLVANLKHNKVEVVRILKTCQTKELRDLCQNRNFLRDLEGPFCFLTSRHDSIPKISTSVNKLIFKILLSHPSNDPVSVHGALCVAYFGHILERSSYLWNIKRIDMKSQIIIWIDISDD